MLKHDGPASRQSAWPPRRLDLPRGRYAYERKRL